MTQSSRDTVLARIRSAAASAPNAVITRDYVRSTPADVDMFVDRLRDYRAVVHRCDDAGIAGEIAQALRDARARRVVLPVGLDLRWRPDGLILLDDGERRLVAADLDGPDVAVITSCAVAIAETGTIVLDAGPGQGRRLLTLVPDHHVCVVREAQVVGSVPDAFQVLEPTRPLTWISGPSATSDIELRRVEGVHGPRHLIVIIVAGDPPVAPHPSTRSPAS